MIQDWDIKPRGDTCHECNTAFEDNQHCHSFLAFGQEGYTRGDCCDKCWSEKGAAANAFSVWAGFFKKPPPPIEQSLKKENAEALLRRMMTDADPTKRNLIYILAIMLERKRVLVEKDIQTRDDGVTIVVYEHKKTGETFLVPDPKLGFDQLAQVQQEVAEMLGIPPKGSRQAAKVAEEQKTADQTGIQPEAATQPAVEDKQSEAVPVKEETSEDSDMDDEDKEDEFDEDDEDEFDEDDEDDEFEDEDDSDEEKD